MRLIERSNAWRVNRTTAQLQRSKATFPCAKKSWLLAALNFRVFLKPLRRLAMNANVKAPVRRDALPETRPSVAMVVMVLFTLCHRNDAAMRHLTDHMLELDGRVVDAEVVQQAFLHIAQDAFAD